MALVFVLLQTTWFAIEFTADVGFTIIEKVSAGPWQDKPLFVKVGKTLIVPLIGLLDKFWVVKGLIFPNPVEPKPIWVFEFDQLYDVPVPDIEINWEEELLQ